MTGRDEAANTGESIAGVARDRLRHPSVVLPAPVAYDLLGNQTCGRPINDHG